MFLNYELELEPRSLAPETVASRLSASSWGCRASLHSHMLMGLSSASQDTGPGRVKPLDKGAWFWLGELGWWAQAGEPGDEGGRAGGWGPWGPAGGKLGPLPRGVACSSLPTGTAPGHGCPHNGRPCGPHGASAISWRPHRGRGAAGKGFVTSTPKPDLGGTEACVCPKSSCRGGRKACPCRWHRPLTQGSAWTVPGSPARPFTLQPGAGVLRGLGRVSGPLWAATAPPRQEVPTCQPRASGAGAGSTGWGQTQPPQHGQWQLRGWLFLGLPGEFRNLALAHALPSPSPSLPFLRAPGHPAPHRGPWGRACCPVRQGPVTDEETEPGRLLPALPGGLHGPRAASSAGLPHRTPDQPIPSRAPTFLGARHHHPHLGTAAPRPSA
ncbi:collagen alpha-1(I) chain-like [Pteropus vampyrus]|uniref:Collagen alpha-1(I) chain-like n=1 Tax=Pteropus vampyrus TaxID=132908 RepID=A0A6P6CMM4_PTEVA|nr:collagen alpha-1(I) chain-like [Pteropus vampyrus]XP_023388554.1 collagen alpha-1(I) chain-like [Pteropus vampyrus]